MKIIIPLIQKIREEYILLTKFGPIQREWLRFLKNNPLFQGKNRLGRKDPDGTYKACCLGQFGLMTGICKWDVNYLISCAKNKFGDFSETFPAEEDMLKYGFYGNIAPSNMPYKNSLGHINDVGTWLDVYHACINDPKGYFSKKV
jgi:hypothetical protein